MWGQFMWIDHRNHPGGPLKFLADSNSSWSFILAFAANAAANILGDGLLVRPDSLRDAAQVAGGYVSNSMAHRYIDVT
jgi:hypothetical protein